MQVILAAAVAVLAGYGTASAQGVGVEVYAGDPYYRYYEPRPRVYGYYRSEAEPPRVVVPAPVRPDNCGVYRYWDGAKCADARINPPNLVD
jgi:hypothetical protein